MSGLHKLRPHTPLGNQVQKAAMHSVEDEYRAAFRKFDVNGDGKLDIWEIRRMFQSIGATPTETELFHLASVAASGDGSLSFEDFVKVLRTASVNANFETHVDEDKSEALDAFVSLGGHRDKTGTVETERIRDVILQYGLSIDAKEVIQQFAAGKDAIDFDSLSAMLAS